MDGPASEKRLQGLGPPQGGRAPRVDLGALVHAPDYHREVVRAVRVWYIVSSRILLVSTILLLVSTIILLVSTIILLVSRVYGAWVRGCS